MTFFSDEEAEDRDTLVYLPVAPDFEETEESYTEVSPSVFIKLIDRTFRVYCKLLFTVKLVP